MSDDPEVTSPGALTPEAQTAATLMLLLEGQREVVPLARTAVQAQIDRDTMRGEAYAAMRDAARSRVGGSGIAVLACAVALVLLSWAGIEVDLAHLATTASEAWRGECVPMGAPALPASDGDGGFMGPEAEPR